MTTIAAVDGSCIGNPGPGGWAWVTGDGREGSAAARNTTNNRIELRSALELLRSIPSGPLLVQSDSANVIRVFTRWLENWRTNGYRNNSKKPMENRDLIEDIDALLRGRNVAWEKVPAHAGHQLNERANALANAAPRRTVTGRARRRPRDRSD